MLLLLGIILFIGLVVVHEFGHFIVARRNGVVVEEFGIGFPPRLFKKRMKSGFILSFNLLPLGGFVRLKGEHDSSKLVGSFGAAPLWSKVKIMTAGVLMNLATAFILLTVLGLFGIPKLIDNQFSLPADNISVSQVEGKDTVLIDRVLEDSPAAKAGLNPNDQIINIGGTEIKQAEDVGRLTKAYAGKEVSIAVRRDQNIINVRVKLNNPDQAQNGYLGIAAISGEHGIEVNRHTWSAPIVALGLIKQISGLTYRGLGTIITSLFHGDTHTASEQVAGPVGVFVLLNESTALGIRFLIMVIAIISLTLALMNVLPIPALDGGRIFVTLLFKVLHKPLTKEREELIHATGFFVLIAIFILITIIDVKRIL